MIKNRFQIAALFFLAALQLSDMVFWVWSRMLVGAYGSFVVSPLHILTCAIAGTGICYWLIVEISKR